MHGTPGPTGMRLRDGGWMSQGAVRRMGENAVAEAMISLSATGGVVSKRWNVHSNRQFTGAFIRL